mgnify:CR=1 FL=1
MKASDLCMVVAAIYLAPHLSEGAGVLISLVAGVIAVTLMWRRM